MSITSYFICDINRQIHRDFCMFYTRELYIYYAQEFLHNCFFILTRGTSVVIQNSRIAINVIPARSCPSSDLTLKCEVIWTLLLMLLLQVVILAWKIFQMLDLITVVSLYDIVYFEMLKLYKNFLSTLTVFVQKIQYIHSFLLLIQKLPQHIKQK